MYIEFVVDIKNNILVMATSLKYVRFSFYILYNYAYLQTCLTLFLWVQPNQ